jgi:hypothetical protein
VAVAAKYAVAHNGVLLSREKQHLGELGVSMPKYLEILFLAGHITATNMLMVHLVDEGSPVEDILRAVRPPRHGALQGMQAHNPHCMI